MQNLIPCRFHIEVEAVLKSEGLRATKQRLNIWDELSSTEQEIIIKRREDKRVFLNPGIGFEIMISPKN